MLFAEIIGHADLKKQLLHSVKEKKMSHAQLFLGAEGSGNLALALAFAQYINCENQQTHDSCGDCRSCRKAQKMIHPDLHYSYPFIAKGTPASATKATDWVEQFRDSVLTNPYLNYNEWMDNLRAENKQGNITAGECRDIIRKLSFRTFEGKFKVLILWLPEYLGKEGNILLKTLEEPPNDTIIILVAQSEERILQTILSRTQLLRIPRLTDDDMINYLVEKGNLPIEKANQIAMMAEGNLNLAKQELKNLADDKEEWLRDWVSACAKNETVAIGKWIDEITTIGRENQKQFIRYALGFIRESLLLNISSSSKKLRERELKMATWLNEKFTLSQFEKLISLFEKTHAEIERNASGRILFTDLSLSFIHLLKNQVSFAL